MRYVLYRSTDGTENDGEVECFGLAPLVQKLITQGCDFCFRQVRHALEFSRVASNKSALLQQGENVRNGIFVSKLLNIVENLGLAQVGKRVLDSMLGLDVAEEMPSGACAA